MVSSTVDGAGPVAIGGVGGSGTRLVASMVAALGFRTGNDLNWADDDLAFTVLFKRPTKYRGGTGLIEAGHPAARAATTAFVQLRTSARVGGHSVSLFEACASMAFSSALPVPPRRFTWCATRFRRSLRPSSRSGSGPWTWKEPNTLMFLPTLFAQVPGLRYIHVVRDGRSMAKSRNMNQVTNWGYRFGMAHDDRSPQVRQLVYWARANAAVADFLDGRARSLVVSHERTVHEPTAVVAEIAAFLERPVTDAAHAVADRVERPDDFSRSFWPEPGLWTDAERDETVRALVRFGYPSDLG